MARRCSGTKERAAPAESCRTGGKAAPGAGAETPLCRFSRMIENCLEYAEEARRQGRPIVGIMCEFTPREVIMAAGGVPVCLCGGHAEMIPPAEEDLPANLCPLIKSTYGFHKRKANPFLEMADLVVAETTCDGKKKMFELMGQERPLYVLELPQKPDRPEGLEQWRREIRGLKEELERRFGTTVTDDKLRSAIAVMNQERRLRRGLAELMQAPAPPLTGRQLLDLKSIISCIPADLDHYRLALEWLRAQPPPADAASRVRVLMTGVPLVHGAERVLEIVEDYGGLVVCLESCTGLKPILEDVDESAPDPLGAIAAKYYHLPCSVMTRNEARMEWLRRLAAAYRPQCVIELVWQACLTYDVESYHVRALAGKDLGVPYLRIETDYSPADSARIALRVEALFETVRAGPPGRRGG